MNRQELRKLLIITSFLLFPITMYYFSPYLIIMGAFEGIVSGSMMLFLGLFIFSIFGSRLFCGWMCPAGGLGEICQVTNNKPNKGGWRKLLKYAIWVPWMGVIILAVLNAGGLSKLDFLYMTVNGVSISEPFAYIIFYIVIVIIVIASVIAGRRSFCHSICWMAPFMIFGTRVGRVLKLPQVHIKTIPERCINCLQCTKVCQMSLPVDTYIKDHQVKSTDCILCGACVDICPKETLSFTVGKVKGTK